MLKPLRDVIITRPERMPEKTEGGIYLPETVRGRGNVHEVLAVGPEVKSVKPGDKVLTAQWAGHTFRPEGGGEELCVIGENEVWAVVEGGEA